MLSNAGFNNIASAESGLDCIFQGRKYENPDVIIIDEGQCYINEMDIIINIRYSWPEAKIIILTGVDSDLDVNLLPDDGYMFFMDKNSITADNLPQLLYNIVTEMISLTKVPQANKVFNTLRRSFTGMLNSILI
jgi:DNA-binding NarL/FixJ family response regulator